MSVCLVQHTTEKLVNVDIAQTFIYAYLLLENMHIWHRYIIFIMKKESKAKASIYLLHLLQDIY